MSIRGWHVVLMDGIHKAHGWHVDEEKVHKEKGSKWDLFVAHREAKIHKWGGRLLSIHI